MESSDSIVLARLGRNLEQHRLRAGLTQAALAADAGLGRATVQRLENGESVQVSSLIRVLRVLGLLDELTLAVAPPLPSPLDELRREGRVRRRARPGAPPKPAQPWTWGDDEGGSA